MDICGRHFLTENLIFRSVAQPISSTCFQARSWIFPFPFPPSIVRFILYYFNTCLMWNFSNDSDLRIQRNLSYCLRSGWYCWPHQVRFQPLVCIFWCAPCLCSLFKCSSCNTHLRRASYDRPYCPNIKLATSPIPRRGRHWLVQHVDDLQFIQQQHLQYHDELSERLPKPLPRPWQLSV